MQPIPRVLIGERDRPYMVRYTLFGLYVANILQSPVHAITTPKAASLSYHTGHVTIQYTVIDGLKIDIKNQLK